MLDEAIRNVFRQRTDLIVALNINLGFDVGSRIAEFQISSREEMSVFVDKIVVTEKRNLIFSFVDGNVAEIRQEDDSSLINK